MVAVALDENQRKAKHHPSNSLKFELYHKLCDLYSDVGKDGADDGP